LGRSAFILFIGLVVEFGIFTFGMNNSFEKLSASEEGQYKNSYARTIARYAIHAMLRGYAEGSSPIPTSGSYDRGTYSLNTATHGDTLWITSVGTYSDSHYTMKVKLLRTTKPFPISRGALDIRSTLVSYTFPPGIEIDGRNHSEDGRTLIHSGDLSGITTRSETDATRIKKIVGMIIKGKPIVRFDSSFVDLREFIEDNKHHADFRYSSPGKMRDTTWGSLLSPAIVYCDGGSNSSFAIQFTGRTVGYGILIVRGNVQFDGPFEFHGLILLDCSESQMTFEVNGISDIVGSVLLSGNSQAAVTFQGDGSNTKIKYSAEALDRVENMGKLRYYSILDWYE